MPKASLALRNLRGVLIVLILAFHSFAAYIVSQPAASPPFDQPPYDWRAFPIIDHERWLGFDVFCAFQFLYLMQLMFFLSGLFVWPSLQQKGWKAFLGHRLFRLGVPFLLGAYLVMPIAFYPVYRVTAVDPSWLSYWAHWKALPITPTGPMWFLWFLIVLNVGAALLFRLAPGVSRLLSPLLAQGKTYPARFLGLIIVLTGVAYLPLSAIYSPWKWVGFGPFEVQAAFAPQYMLYFLFGLALGTYGYDRGLLDLDGSLARRWAVWATGSFGGFLLWIIPTALIVKDPDAPVALLQVVGDLGLVTFAAAACLGMIAVFLRFATSRWPVIDSVAEHAYGIYFFHYLFALWLQYMLLGLDMPAIVKGLLVLTLTLLLSWGAAAVVNWIVASIPRRSDAGTALLTPPPAPSGRFSETKSS